jgi:hypothetical protein
MDFCIRPFLSCPEFFLLSFILYGDNGHFAQWSSSVGPCSSYSGLLYGLLFGGNYQYLGVSSPASGISTYMDSGFRTSKTLPVNPALTLCILKPVVTGTVKGQSLSLDPEHL